MNDALWLVKNGIPCDIALSLSPAETSAVVRAISARDRAPKAGVDPFPVTAFQNRFVRHRPLTGGIFYYDFVKNELLNENLIPLEP